MEKYVGFPSISLTYNIRELQEINYPILWGGHLARPMDWAGKMPTPQELIGYFLSGSPLAIALDTCNGIVSTVRITTIYI